MRRFRALASVCLIALFLVAGIRFTPESKAADCSIGAISDSSTASYNFNSDVAGEVPSNVTEVSGTLEVNDHSTQGNSLHPLSSESKVTNPAGANLAIAGFDNVPIDAVDMTVTWKHVFSGGSDRNGMLLRYDTDAATGYLFQVNPSDARIYSFTSSTVTQLASTGLANSSGRYFKASIQGTSLEFCYSNDGVTYTQLSTVTNSAYSIGTVAYSGGWAGTTVTVSYIDDVNVEYVSEDPAVTITESGGSTDVTEDGTTDSYTVVLESIPDDDVVVTPTSADTSNGVTVSPSSLTFTSANWDTPQTITVTAVDDLITENSHTTAITHAASSSDSNYNGISISSVTANITDNETVGVTITESSGSTNVTEDGTTDTYTVVLGSLPTDDVVVTPTSADTDDGVTVSPSSLTFTTGNWDTAQTVTVTAVDDSTEEGNHTTTISHAAVSDDSNYDGVSINSVTANITDNEIDAVYDFESDTVSQQPADTTLVRGGTGLVVDDATLGSQALQLTDGGSQIMDILLDNVPTTSVDLDMEFIKKDVTSDRLGILMFSNSTAQTGYLIQWDNTNDDRVEIFKRSSASPYTHSQLAQTASIPTTTDRKWRATASVSGSSTTITLYSWDGDSWSQELQTTDSSSAYTSGGIAFNQLQAVGNAVVDDIEVNYVGGALSITTPKQYQVFQRDGSNVGDISVSGSYSGTPSAIEARFNSGSWATIDGSPSGGTFSGTLSDQSAGQGTFEVRFVDDADATASQTYVGVGDIFAAAGQSNASGRGNNNQSYSHATLKASKFTGSWAELTDPADSSGGTVWPLIATLFMADQGVPIAFITDPPLGGTSISQWQKGQSLYTTLTSRVNAVGDVKAVLYWQGESDSVSGTAQATYNASLDAMVDDIQADFGVKTVVAQIGEVGNADLADLNGIRLGQRTAWDDNTNALAGPTLYDVNLSVDSLHFKTDAELQTAANRWWAAIEKHFYSGSDGRGPQFVSAEENADRTDVFVTFSDDTLPLLPASSIQGFVVDDDGSPATISSVSRVASNTIAITVSSALSGTVTVSLGDGDTANGLTVPTDSSTYNLPAEVFIDESVSTATAPTISSVASTPSSTSAVITWTTNESSSTQVEYGLTTSYGSSTTESDTSTRVTSHSDSISGLTACTVYHYRVVSTDVAENQATGSDNTFTTTGCPDGGGGSSGSGGGDEGRNNSLGDNAINLVVGTIAGSDVTTSTSDENQTSFTVQQGQTFSIATKPIDADRLQELRLRVNGQIYQLHNTSTDPNNPRYTLSLPAFLSPGLYPYSLTADYGFTTSTVKGIIVVEGAKKISTPVDVVVTIASPQPIPTRTNTPASFSVLPDRLTLDNTVITEGIDEVVEEKAPVEEKLDSSTTEDSVAEDERDRISITQTLAAFGRNVFGTVQGAMSALAGLFDRTPELPEHLKGHMYDRVAVRLLDDQQQPLVGATVTLFSEPKTAITDETGTAVFEDVEAGEHTMKVAYTGYNSSQKLFLDKDSDEVQIATQATLRQGVSPVWWGLSVIAALCLGFGMAWRMRGK